MNMKKKINVAFELTNKCNANCLYCMRPQKGESFSSLKFSQVCDMFEKFGRSNDLFDFRIRLSGGEPLLWKDSPYTITDLLLASSDSDLDCSIVTNGLLLESNIYMYETLLPAIQKMKTMLSLYVSIDLWHGNYKIGSDVSAILDNIYDVLLIDDFKNKISVYIQSTFTTETKDNITNSFIRKYAEKGFNFHINPLLPWGRGREMHEKIPKLKIGETCKKALGAYMPILYKLGLDKNIWNDYKGFLNFDNFKLLHAFDYCANSIYVNNKGVFTCNYFEDFRVSSIESFNISKYQKFIKNNKWIDMIKSKKLLSLMENSSLCNEDLFFDYGRCSICKYLRENSI